MTVAELRARLADFPQDAVMLFPGAGTDVVESWSQINALYFLEREGHPTVCVAD